MKKFETDCDMGCIKIYNEGLSCFFENGIGDVSTIVYVQEEREDKAEKSLPLNMNETRFLGHFTVRDEAYLSEYDCADDPIYTFGKGRWFVTLLDTAIILISKADEDLHA